jgi:hypothetical protein
MVVTGEEKANTLTMELFSSDTESLAALLSAHPAKFDSDEVGRRQV